MELLAGLNTIRATSIGANGGNFDHLVITKITASTLAPVFSPVPGTYNSPVAVTLSSSTSGASIYYTVDGSTPTTSSTLYTAPVSVNTSTTIKAIAVDASLLSSEVIEGTYVIQTTPPFSVTLEAESAARSGVLILFSYTGYTGTGYGDFVNASNDYLEWTVDVPSSGMYEIGFRYALLNGNRPLRIDVNSSTIESSLSFPVTASWTNWSMIKKWIPLAAGPNKIKAIAIGSSGPNIDHITVSNDASSGSLTAARSKQFYDEMESQLTNVIDIFPVPANQTLHVSGPSAVEFVNIIQMDGRIVVPYHQYTRENSIEVDVSNIPSGLSVVTLRDGKQIIRKKVLIQH